MELKNMYRIDDKSIDRRISPSWRDDPQEVGNLGAIGEKSLMGFLRAYRDIYSHTQKEMRELLGGLSHSYYADLENGKRKLGERLLVRMTNYLELTDAERQELFEIWVLDSGVCL